MSFWNKFGKIALQAAPYVAAPFTGGASLAATGLTEKLGQKWAASDARKAEAKGLAPSNFDKILGRVSAGVGLGTSVLPTGALGKVGLLGKAGKLGSTASKVSKLGKVAAIAGNLGGRRGGGVEIGSDMPSQGGISGNMGGNQGIDWGGGTDWGGLAGGISNMIGNNGGNPQQQASARQAPGGLGPSEQAVSRNLNRTPNLEDYISQGHEEALYDQPWRKPYPASIYKGIGGNRRFQGSYEQGISPGSY